MVPKFFWFLDIIVHTYKVRVGQLKSMLFYNSKLESNHNFKFSKQTFENDKEFLQIKCYCYINLIFHKLIFINSVQMATSYCWFVSKWRYKHFNYGRGLRGLKWTRKRTTRDTEKNWEEHGGGLRGTQQGTKHTEGDTEKDWEGHEEGHIKGHWGAEGDWTRHGGELRKTQKGNFTNDEGYGGILKKKRKETKINTNIHTK